MGFFLTFILAAITFVLTELLKPKPNVENAKPVGIGDFNFPTATEQRPIPIVWGRNKLSGPNVTWYGDLRQEAITRKVKTGLFSSSTQTIGFRYFLGVQMSLCRGTQTSGIEELRRIWVGDDVLWSDGITAEGTFEIDEPDFFGGESLGSGGLSGTIAFYPGTESQSPDSYLSNFQDEGGDTPAYRGTCYIVARAFYFGTATGIQPWSFEVERYPDNLALAGNRHIVNGDANPAEVLYEVLTNDEWGLGFPVEDIEIASFQAAGNTLFDEDNGFSMVLDRDIEVTELMRIIEQQIDGVIVLDRSTGKWIINLARGDYDIDLVPQLSETNIVEVKDFSRGSWEETSNEVQIEFIDRSRDYFGTYALAQDIANQRIQGGQNISVTERYPGVKTADLANQIAWRQLRTSSFTLAKATIVVDRTVAQVNPGDVVAWSDVSLGLFKFPMRVTRVDLGNLSNGSVILSLVQDVFVFANPSFSAPPPSGWTPPSNIVVDIPSADRLIFEAPRAFVERDPVSPGSQNRIWCGARYQSDGAVEFDIRQRNSAGTPGGAFSPAGTVPAFLLAGELAQSMSADDSNPVSGSLVIEATPDTKTMILNQFESLTEQDVGVDLAQLVLVGDEFMLIQNATSGAGNTISTFNVYRGMLDTTPKNHPAGTRIWFLFVAGNLATTIFPANNNVDIKLIPRSGSGELDEGLATQTQIDLQLRDNAPYPPLEMRINATRYPAVGGVASVNFNGGGSHPDNLGSNVAFNRRWFLKTDETDIADDDTVDTMDTRYRVLVRVDPDGANTLVFTSPYNDVGQDTVFVSRTGILAGNGGTLPTRLRYEVEARHTTIPPSTVQSSVQSLDWDFDPLFSLEGDFEFGQHFISEVSALYTVDADGDHTITLGDSEPIANGGLEYRVDGGTWTTGAASGSFIIAGLTIGQTIEFRHNASTGSGDVLYQLDAPGAGTDGWGIASWT